MMDFGSCYMGNGLFFGYGWLFQIVIFVAFFLVVWWLLKSNKSFSVKSERRTLEKPMDILKKRLASGEITKKEYESLKKEIE